MKVKILTLKLTRMMACFLLLTACGGDPDTVPLAKITPTKDYSNMILDVSQVVKMVIKGSPGNASEKLSWFTTNADVLAVLSNENGRVAGIKGLSPGVAAITVRTEKGNLVKSYAVEVLHKLNRLDLKQASLSRDGTQIKYEVLFNQDQNPDDNIATVPSTYKEVIWKSSNESVAKVDKHGVVRAVKAGASGSAVFVTITAWSTEYGIISESDLKNPSVNLVSTAHDRIVLGEPAKFSPIIIPKYCKVAPGGAYNADAVSTTGGTTNINYTGAAPAGNYSLEIDESVTISKGGIFKLSVTNSNGWSRSLVWVDWNLDGDFTDPGEALGPLSKEKFSSGNDPIDYEIEVKVPAEAVLGDVKMRVLTGDAWTYEDAKIPKEPCGALRHSGVKDFNIKIVE